MNKVTARDVLLYVPNLIGYARVALVFVSFGVAIFVPSLWYISTAAYLLSFVGDLFDGVAARKLNQTSTYGGLLDMITDRCATTGLLFILAGEYGTRPDDMISCFFRAALLFLIILDISSHWCQMFFTATQNQHHKAENSDSFFLVNLYYQVYAFFGYCCVGTEFFYIALYVLVKYHPVDGETTDVINNLGCLDGNTNVGCYMLTCFLCVCLPACITKQIVNLTQLCSACYAIAQKDAILKNK